MKFDMDKPLFIMQSVCKDRQMCRECRDLQNATYRDGWAERYEMPSEWPKCPVGFAWGHQGPPKAVPPSLLGITVDQPDSSESVDIMRRIRARADHVRPICQSCPGSHCNKIFPDGLTVSCEKAHKCCSGDLRPGNVYLGSGVCQMGYW